MNAFSGRTIVEFPSLTKPQAFWVALSAMQLRPVVSALHYLMSDETATSRHELMKSIRIRSLQESAGRGVCSS